MDGQAMRRMALSFPEAEESARIAKRASCCAAWAAALSPRAIASSTLRRNVRMRLARDRFTAVLCADWRMRFLAERILAMPDLPS